MNSILTTIYSGYEDVYVVHRDQYGLGQIAELLDISRNNVKGVSAEHLLNMALQCPLSSLIVIDVNSVGVKKTDQTLFLLKCFLPHIPTVLIATDLPERARERYITSGVLAIIQGAGPTPAMAIAA